MKEEHNEQSRETSKRNKKRRRGMNNSLFEHCMGKNYYDGKIRIESDKTMFPFYLVKYNIQLTLK